MEEPRKGLDLPNMKISVGGILVVIANAKIQRAPGPAKRRREYTSCGECCDHEYTSINPANLYCLLVSRHTQYLYVIEPIETIQTSLIGLLVLSTSSAKAPTANIQAVSDLKMVDPSDTAAQEES